MDQEDASSCVISSPCNPRTNINVDTSGSDNIHNQTIRTGKRPRHDNDSTAKVPKYKGVVPQQNGHWGAQIYANQSRHWLGTFKSEKEAAMAYDSAAIKLRSGDSRRNLPWTALTTQEYNFQIPFSEEEVLNMIRDGSYQPKFQQFLRLQCGKGLILPGIIQNMVHRDGNFTCMQLFQKELTPSDVGKLNRLVIPKRFAVMYFPYVPEDNVGGGIAETELVFHDRLMKPWKFRYSFWTSSQSYVFTKGWSGFVKEKNLKEKDIVTFHKCMSRWGQHFSIIDVTYSSGQVNGVNPFQERAKEFQLELGLGHKVKNHMRDSEKVYRSKEYSNNNVNGSTSFRLFGVSIEEGNCSTNFPS